MDLGIKCKGHGWKTTLSEVFTNNSGTNVEDEEAYEEEANDDEDTQKTMDAFVAIELYSDYM